MKFRHSYLIALLAGLFFLAQAPLYAQENGKSKGSFFDRDTVKRGFFEQNQKKNKEAAKQQQESENKESFAAEGTAASSGTSSGPSETKKSAQDSVDSAVQASTENKQFQLTIDSAKDMAKKLEGLRQSSPNHYSEKHYNQVIKALKHSETNSQKKKKKPTAFRSLGPDTSVKKAKKTRKKSLRSAPKKRSKKPANARASLKRTDPEQESFKPKSVLSLIISGKNEKHLEQHFKQLAQLSQYQNVKAGNVFIVGGLVGQEQEYEKTMNRPDVRKKLNLENQQEPTAEQVLALRNRVMRKYGSRGRSLDQITAGKMLKGTYSKYLAAVGMRNHELVPGAGVLERLKITYSPTWIVRHLGRDYVFEGFMDPTHLFNSRGEFIRADY